MNTFERSNNKLECVYSNLWLLGLKFIIFFLIIHDSDSCVDSFISTESVWFHGISRANNWYMFALFTMWRKANWTYVHIVRFRHLVGYTRLNIESLGLTITQWKLRMTISFVFNNFHRHIIHVQCACVVCVVMSDGVHLSLVDMTFS